jgi:hypothetical protein
VVVRRSPSRCGRHCCRRPSTGCGRGRRPRWDR